MAMFEQPYAVTFSSELLDGVTTHGMVRGAYQNPAIAPDEKVLVVEVETDLDEVNELARVNTMHGWANAILTEDAEPFFASGEPLESVRAMMNMADAVLANKLHPCMNGDLFGNGQMFTSENLSNFRAAGEHLGLAEGPQFQTFLIANPLFEIAVGEGQTQQLMELCTSFDEVQSAYDAGTAVWNTLLENYRTAETISIWDADAGTFDVCRGIYLGRTDGVFGNSEHIGICNRGLYTYDDNWQMPVNVAKSLIPIVTEEDLEGRSEYVFTDTQRLKADFGWVPEPELVARAAGLPFYAQNVTDLSQVDMDIFGGDVYDEEMEG